MLLVSLLLASIVGATYTITVHSPSAYSIQNSTSVLYNFTAVDSGGSSTFNCSLYTKMASTDNYTINTTVNVANNTAENFTLVYTDDSRVWFKIGCWDQENEFTTSNEAITVPTSGSQVTFANGDDGVIVTAVAVNYTQDVVNESITIPANGTQLALGGNGTITTVTLAIENHTGVYNTTLVAGTDYYLSGGIVTMNSTTYAGNTSLWTYTFKNYTALTADNYNSTNGVYYMNTSTYAGDDSFWNYTYPFNSFVNEVNTTQSIFDVDDYYNEFINVWIPIRLVPQAQGTCDTSSEGTMYYDTTAKNFQGCNSTDWVVLG